MAKGAHSGAHSAAPVKKEKRPAPARIKKETREEAPKPKKEKREKKVKELTPEELAEKTARRAEKVENVKAGSYKVLVIITIIVAFITLGSVALYFVGKNVSESDVNLPNVYVDGIHVGALTKDQTRELLISEGWLERNSGTLKVTIPKDVSFEVDYVDSGASLTLDKVVEDAYNYGHDRSILNNTKTWVRGLMKAKDVGTVKKQLNTELISATVDEAIAIFDDIVACMPGYEVDMEKAVLRMEKGAGEASLNREELISFVCDSLTAGEREVVYSPELTVSEPDFKMLLSVLSSQPQDAYYDKETDSIVPEVWGASFVVNNARDTWQNTKVFDTLEIPVTLSMPDVTAGKLEELLFRDVLGEKATSLSGSSANRINNIMLVADKLNGLVLMPGEEFSYNGYIGERTEEAGFLGAPAYDNGKVTWEIGGGICQGSSTLYYCSLCADLEILDRTEHDFVVTYLPAGLDATVSYPRPDYKFKNSRDYPIKIKAWVDDNKKYLNVQILGTNLDGGYIEPVAGHWPIYDEVYTKVQVGWGAASYLVYYDADGNQIGDKVYVTNSVYQLHAEDIKWPPEYYQKDDGGEGGGEDG